MSDLPSVEDYLSRENARRGRAPESEADDEASDEEVEDGLTDSSPEKRRAFHEAQNSE
mgnify:CR=1 FL=1